MFSRLKDFRITGSYKSFRMFWSFLIAEGAFNFIWAFESFLSLWLVKYARMDSAAVGLAFSSMAFIGMVTESTLGYIADKLVLKKQLLWFIAIIIICAGPFLQWVIMPLSKTGFNAELIAVALGLYLGTACNAGVTVQEQYLRRASYVNDFEFGWARTGTQVINMLGPVIVGAVLSRFPAYFIWLLTISGLIYGIMVTFFYKFDDKNVGILYDKGDENKKVSVRSVLGTLKSKRFIFFVIFVVTSAPAHDVSIQQIGVYFNSFFKSTAQGTAVFAGIATLAGFLGLIAMIILAPFIQKVSPKAGLLIFAGTSAVYLIGLGISPNWQVAAVSYAGINCFVSPFWWICQMTYVFNVFSKREYSTIQSLSTGVFYEIGMLVLSYFTGIGYDKIGFGKSYLLLAALSVFALIFGFFTLEKTRPEAELIKERQTAQDNKNIMIE